jgi:iron complex transport system ATP-binding protein
VEDLISLGKYIYYPFYFELKKKTVKVIHIIEELDLNNTDILFLKIFLTEIFKRHLSEEQ